MCTIEHYSAIKNNMNACQNIDKSHRRYGELKKLDREEHC